MRRAHHGVDLAGARSGDLADELPGAGVDDRQGGRGRGRRHAPTNSGARFSTNAFRPSLASLEWNSDSISSGLEREPVAERQLAALVHAALDGRERERRARGQPLGPLAQARLVAELGHEAPPLRLLGSERAAGQEQVQRP